MEDKSDLYLCSVVGSGRGSSRFLVCICLVREGSLTEPVISGNMPSRKQTPKALSGEIRFIMPLVPTQTVFASYLILDLLMLCPNQLASFNNL